MSKLSFAPWLMALALTGSLTGMVSAQSFTGVVTDQGKAYQKEWSKAAEQADPDAPRPDDSRSEAEARRQSVTLGSMLGLPKVGDEQAVNVLGVVQYCIKDGLGDEPMQIVHAQLLDRIHAGDMAALEQMEDYQLGLGGTLAGQDDAVFDLKTMDKQSLRKPACDYVAYQASSLL